MSKKGKEYLKNKFSKGALPTESDFALLIDSMFNLEDDGFEELIDGPLRLYVKDHQEKKDKKQTLLEFYASILDTKESGAWKFAMSENDKQLFIKDQNDRVVVSIDQNGRVKFDAEFIDLGGVASRIGTIGTFQSTNPKPILANGEWQTLVNGLSGCQMFDIVAGVGYKENNRFALLRATASLVPRKFQLWDILLPRFTPRNAQIQVTQSYSCSSRDKIDLKWMETERGRYDLQIRTRFNYGGNMQIRYHLTKLWFDTYVTGNISNS